MARIWIFMLIVLVSVGSSKILIADAKQCAYSDYRLPKHIAPSHYELTIGVDTVRLGYEGSVTIHLSVNDDESHQVAKNVIVLHAAPALQINKIRFRQLDDGPGRHLDILDSCRDDDNELLVVTLKENLAKGARGQLIVDFKADIRTDARGIYRGLRERPDGSAEILVSTQFEPVDARKAFPCFDEPSFKATFELTLIHSADKIALANTAISSSALTDKAAQRQTTKFKTTPLMSTYLLAFVIGEFDYVEQVVADGRIRVRTYTPPGKSHQGQFALETAVRAITLLEDYFDIPFPLEKIDMVAVPDIAEGKAAMENWGLIIYGESGILFDEQQRDSNFRNYIAIYVVHEMAHQWFGNLVTMKWWNDLWLNEGFAAWIQDFLANQLYPEFKIDHYTQVEMRKPALAADTQSDTHPIRFEQVGKNIDEIFDDIVYYKSSSIIKYINDVFVGPEQFKEGVRIYLRKHTYANTEASDLWDELKAASGLPVDEFMKSWLTQPGHPLVRVRLVAGDGKGKKLRLEQERRQPKASPQQHGRANNQTWMIPITVLVSDGRGRRESLSFTFNQSTIEVELPGWFEPDEEGTTNRHWLVLNENSSGFYRVLYEDGLLERLAEPCKSKQIGAYARANLIDELQSHYETGLISAETLRNSLGWFENERVGMILMNLSDAFKVLLNNHNNNNNNNNTSSSRLTQRQLEQLGEKLFKHIYAEYGLNGSGLNADSLTETTGLSSALSALVAINYQPIVDEARA